MNTNLWACRVVTFTAVATLIGCAAWVDIRRPAAEHKTVYAVVNLDGQPGYSVVGRWVSEFPAHTGTELRYLELRSDSTARLRVVAPGDLLADAAGVGMWRYSTSGLLELEFAGDREEVRAVVSVMDDGYRYMVTETRGGHDRHVWVECGWQGKGSEFPDLAKVAAKGDEWTRHFRTPDMVTAERRPAATNGGTPSLNEWPTGSEVQAEIWRDGRNARIWMLMVMGSDRSVTIAWPQTGVTGGDYAAVAKPGGDYVATRK